MGLLDVKRLSFRRRGEDVLSDISFRVPLGGSVAVVGANGSGKSTLLKILLCEARGIESVFSRFSGNVVFDGIDRGRVGYSPQEYSDSILPWESVRQNLVVRGGGAAIELRAVDDAVLSFSNRFGIPPAALMPLMARPGYRLSGGERQRISLLRALLRCPSLVLLDEPLSAADLANRRSMQQALLNYRAAGCSALLMVSHSIEESVLLGDAIMVLGRGRVIGTWEGGHRHRDATEMQGCAHCTRISREVAACVELR